MGIASGIGSALRRKGLRKGLLGGNRFWMLVGFAGYIIRFARRASAKDDRILSTESLRPGETLVIETTTRTTRRERRAERRSRKNSGQSAS